MKTTLKSILKASVICGILTYLTTNNISSLAQTNVTHCYPGFEECERVTTYGLNDVIITYIYYGKKGNPPKPTA